MNAIRNLIHDARDRAATGAIALLTLVLVASAPAFAADPAEREEQRDQSTITTGSGERFRTTVERHTEGSLSSEDLRQASLLTSRAVNHLNDAINGLLDQDTDAARAEIERAQTLSKLVRELLPVTTVTTVVADANGTEVYRDVDQVQDDKIPLYRGMIAVEVVEPIIDAKAKAAAVKGLRLADTDVIRTSVLADLSYIERKLRRASAVLNDPEEALAQLTLAQTQGIEVVVNHGEDPLVEAQYALQLAERMVEEGKHEAARDNLRVAQIQLGTYGALLGKEAAGDVQELEQEIADLTPRTKQKGAAAKIRGFWERATSWFEEQPGQAHPVDGDPDEDVQAPATQS
ncbi:MAG: hypothetical protein DHS20C21_00980 [Gemmatimonadota bacterium]|nr:MAG: hypothetical protein DHS20C21_00980 [Gemmatimonadota bacterium]